jgi:hypothetical protein
MLLTLPAGGRIEVPTGNVIDRQVVGGHHDRAAGGESAPEPETLASPAADATERQADPVAAEDGVQAIGQAGRRFVETCFSAGGLDIIDRSGAAATRSASTTRPGRVR